MRTIVPKDAKLVPEHAECVFKGYIYDVYQWQQEAFDGSYETYEMLKRCDSVQVYVVHEKKLLIQDQEQPHLGKFYSLPGGRHDVPHETELEGAQRELKEETGLVCKNWKLIDAHQLDSKVERFLYTFVASEIIEQTEQVLEAGERIQNIWVPYSEYLDIVAAERFRSKHIPQLKEVSSAEEILNVSEYR